MEIKLNSLTIENFKAIKHFELVPEGKNIRISGQNASGKTSLFDAFTWLLFGKDSQELTKFDAKPLDSSGKEITGAEPMVEAVLEIDGKPTTLRRELKENWVQPRGSLERERKSDTTILTVDSIPKKVNEYKTYINSLIPEDRFRLLTDPAAFNRLEWAKRRDILMELVQGISDSDVMATDDKLKDLDDILDGQSVDDRKKAIKYQRKELKKKIDGVPARIDEAERAKPVISSSNREQLLEMQATYQGQIVQLQNELNSIKAADQDTERLQKIEAIKLEISKKRGSYQSSINLELNSISGNVAAQQESVNEIRRLKSDLESQVTVITAEVKRLAEKRKTLLDEYHYEKEIVFDESATVCPTCGQNLPPEQIDDLRKGFNTRRSSKLEQLTADGKQVTKRLKEQEQVLADSKAVLEKKIVEFDKAQTRLDELNNEYRNQQNSAPKFEATDDYQMLSNQLVELESGVVNVDNGRENEISAQISQLQTSKSTVDSEISRYDLFSAQEARIQALQAEEADLKQTALELDRQDFLIQEFTRAKVDLLESQINKLFSMVQFKLFEIQKNGDLADTAEATVNGIPYSTDLNSGARINAGLDIINVLSKHYEIEAPIFIDNAESVNEILATDSQQITLNVSDDEKLEVEM